MLLSVPLSVTVEEHLQISAVIQIFFIFFTVSENGPSKFRGMGYWVQGGWSISSPSEGSTAPISFDQVICRNFPGAGVPSLRDLGEVSNALLHSMSREAEVEGMDLPPMPTCIPTSPIVLVRN